MQRESYIIDTIHLSAAATDDGEGDERISCIHFYQDVQNVIEGIDLIAKGVTLIAREKVVHQRQLAFDDPGLRSSSSTYKNSIMIGFDDKLQKMMIIS